MAKEKIDITVTPREVGKHYSRQSRLGGQIPAVVYGPKTTPVNVLTDEIAIRKYQGRKFESVIFNLKSDDANLNKVSVILRDIQIHPVSRRPVHIDFYAPDMSKTVRVNVELRLEGKPVGLSEGGVLEHIVRDVEIEVLPSDIPEFLNFDVSGMGLGDAMHVSDLLVPKGVRVISLPTLTVATVSVPKEETAAPVAVAATPEAGATAAAAPAAGAAATAAPATGDKKK
jgi:large subunit ribosomal protein L25